MDRISAKHELGNILEDVVPYSGTIGPRKDPRRNECPNLSCESRYTEYCYCPEYLNKRTKDGD